MEKKPERPNTVAGLIEKRAQLAGMLKHLRAEQRKVICDLDHLDATNSEDFIGLCDGRVIATGPPWLGAADKVSDS